MHFDIIKRKELKELLQIVRNMYVNSLLYEVSYNKEFTYIPVNFD